jgi:hypothetical protein
VNLAAGFGPLAGAKELPDDGRQRQHHAHQPMKTVM